METNHYIQKLSNVVKKCMSWASVLHCCSYTALAAGAVYK